MPAEVRDRVETAVACDTREPRGGAPFEAGDRQALLAAHEEIHAAIHRFGTRGLAAQLAIGAIAARCLGRPLPAALPLLPSHAEVAILTRLESASFGCACLLRCVNVYAMVQLYPFVSGPPALTACHLLDALRLPESEREAMLRRAQGERVTTRAFRAAGG